MPTYDYHCDACGADFEKFQSIKANPIRKCPECGKSRARRLIGAGAGIIFRGSGFYATDYRSDSYKQAAQKDKPDADKKESKDKSDSTKPSSGGGKKD